MTHKGNRIIIKILNKFVPRFTLTIYFTGSLGEKISFEIENDRLP